MKRRLWISVALLAILLQLQAYNCFQLSDAPYAAYLATPQRTGAVNKPVLCPEVSQGRSTVLRQTQSFTAGGYITKHPVMDTDVSCGYNEVESTKCPNCSKSKGSIYIAWFGSPSILYKFDANLTVVKQSTLAASPASAPTILNEGILVSLVDSNVYLFDKSDLSQIGSWTPGTLVYDLLPFGNLLLAGTDNSGFLLFNSTTTFNPYSNSSLLALYNNVIYGIDKGTYQIFASADGININKFTPSLPLIDFTPSIFGDQLVACDGTNAQLLNLTSYQFTTIPTKNFVPVDGSPKFYKDGKLYYPSSCSSGACLTEATTNTTYDISVAQELVYSATDDVLLAGGSDMSTLGGLHLASKTVKLVFEPIFGGTKKRAVVTPTPPMIGDNCAQYFGYGGIYKLEPMPLRRVIPILECIDTLDRMYFSYNNLENDTFVIPRVHDRNDMAVLGKTPFKQFAPGRYDPYPISNIYYQTVNGVDTYTWILEDYVLTFNKNDPALKCPTTFKLRITIQSSKTILPIHLRIMEHVFCIVKGVSTGRVAIALVNTKRGTMQDSTLEAELTIYPTNSTTGGEPSSQQVTESFVYEQAASVNAAFLNDTSLPSDTVITSVSAKELDNSVSGTQVVPPVASPAVPTAPITTPQPPSTPVAKTSLAQRAPVLNLTLFSVYCFVILLF